MHACRKSKMSRVLFPRFCPEKYHPFSADVVDKYVVGDDYLPIWEVPSLKRYYTELGVGMKETFNAYLRSIGIQDPSEPSELVFQRKLI